MRKGVDRGQDAAELRAKLAGVGRAGISSDDPEAVTKLVEKLAAMEDKRSQMVVTNKAWRKAGRPNPDDRDGWRKIADILGRSDNELHQLRIDIAHRMSMFNRSKAEQPFAKYELSNLGGNIKRVRERIKTLSAAAELTPADPRATTIMGVAVTVVEDPDDNRLRLLFTGKPRDSIRAALKNHGFRWSPFNEAWQRQLNGAARFAVDQLEAR